MAGITLRRSLAGLILSCGLSAAPIVPGPNLVGNPSFEVPTVAPSVSQTNSFVNGGLWQIFTAVDRWGFGIPNYGVEFQRNNLYNVPSNTATGGNNEWACLKRLDYIGFMFAKRVFTIMLEELGNWPTDSLFDKFVRVDKLSTSSLSK